MRARILLFSIAFCVGSTITGLAQTIQVESQRVSVGFTVEVPIVLSSAVRGVSAFALDVSLSGGVVADIERVLLPTAFNRLIALRISEDRNAVRIEAQDAAGLIQAGAQNIELVRIVFRGTLNGEEAVQLGVEHLIDDLGNHVNTVTRNGELTVSGGPAAGDAIVLAGTDTARVGEVVETPIILTEAPRGLSSYRLHVELLSPGVARIEDVRFVAFEDDASVELDRNGQAVTFAANDEVDGVRPSERGIILARLRVRGTLPGSTSIQLRISRIEDENGATAATVTQAGTLIVVASLDQPPTFSSPKPNEGLTIEISQPTLSVAVDDDQGDVVPDSLFMRVGDGQGTYTFTRNSPGALWDGWGFRVNLDKAGVMLVPGEVTVEVGAEDGNGNRNEVRWSFTVAGGGPGPGDKTVEAAIAALIPGDPVGLPNADRIIGDREIRQAIQLWISGAPVPGTGGATLDDAKILALIQLWILGAMV